MVMPITGPYESVHASASVYEIRRWQRQARPYNLPLTGMHSLTVNTGFRGTLSIGGTAVQPSTWPANTGLVYSWPNGQYAKNRVVGNLLEKLAQADQASLGVALIQYSQLERTIVQRSRQVLDFAIGLRRFDLQRCMRALGVSADRYRERIPDMPKTNRALRTRTWRSEASDFGGAFLEWSWGIAPTLSDIHKASEIMSHGSDKVIHFRESASERFVVESLSPYSGSFVNWRYTGKSFYVCGGTATLKKPNRLLFSQLGLDDVLGMGFEVIPWSFLLSWVSNVETYLKNWSPLRELYSFDGLYEVRGARGSVYEWFGSNGYPVTGSRDFLVKTTWKEPLTVLPKADFRFKPLRFRPLRAANAIALLSTFLRDPRK